VITVVIMMVIAGQGRQGTAHAPPGRGPNPVARACADSHGAGCCTYYYQWYYNNYNN